MDERILPATLPVARALTNAGANFYIGGSIASSIFGISHSTQDVDFIAALRARHAKAMADELEETYYLDRDAMIRAAHEERSFNLIHLETMMKVDVFPVRRPYDERAIQRIRHEPLLGDAAATLPIAAPEDVILSKLEWYRKGGETSERQWLDVLNVLRVQAGRLDEAYLDQWAVELGVADLLARVRQQAT